MTAARVVTTHVYPPIPDRQFDWCAYFDGEEEAGQYGWGATEQAAVDDLVTNAQPDRNAHVAKPFRSIINNFSGGPGL